MQTTQLLQQIKALAALPQEAATAMPPGVYTSAELLELEQQQIFNRQWLCAGRADALEKPGDYLTYSVGAQPIVIIRQKDHSVSAFANICRHRMMRLLEGRGSSGQTPIVCPYHAWSYAQDGRLLLAPQMEQRPGFDKSDYSLAPVRVELWQGWIYVTLDDSLPPLADTLGALHELVEPYQMQHYIEVVQQDHLWNTNWKLLTENFMEGYHLPVAHKATVGAHFPLEHTRFGKSADPAFTFQWFRKTDESPAGRAHPDNQRLQGEQRYTSIMPTVFPTHMYVLAPDHLWYLSLQPQGVDQVRIRYGAALAPEVLAASEDSEATKQGLRDLLERVNEEDRTVVEGIFAGAKAPLSSPGPLCWLERENHEFTRYLARMLETQT